MNNNSSLYSMLEEIYPICDKIDETQFGLLRRVPKQRLRDVLRLEIIAFAMYLSASDGKITPHEAKWLGDLLKTPISTAAVASLIREKHIYSEAFEQRIPVALQCFVNMDNARLSSGRKPDVLFSDLLLAFYQAAGEAFLLCDGGDEGNEREDLAIYLGNLRKYVRQELNC